MKKLFVLIFMLVFAAATNAQMTTVSAIVVDSDSTIWANGTWNITFLPNPAQPNIGIYNINGTPLSAAVLNQSGTLNGSGAFSVSIYQSAAISPVGSSWSLNVCPLASAICGNYKFSTASNATMNLSSILTTIILAPRFAAVAGTYGYNDIEAQIQTSPGSTYFNVTSPQSQRCYNSIAWQACASAGGFPSAIPCAIATGCTNATTAPAAAVNIVNGNPIAPSGVTVSTQNYPGIVSTNTHTNTSQGTPEYAIQGIGIASANNAREYVFDAEETDDGIHTNIHKIGYQAILRGTDPAPGGGIYGHIVQTQLPTGLYGGAAYQAETDGSPTVGTVTDAFHSTDGFAGNGLHLGAYLQNQGSTTSTSQIILLDSYLGGAFKEGYMEGNINADININDGMTIPNGNLVDNRVGIAQNMALAWSNGSISPTSKVFPGWSAGISLLNPGVLAVSANGNSQDYSGYLVAKGFGIGGGDTLGGLGIANADSIGWTNVAGNAQLAGFGIPYTTIADISIDSSSPGNAEGGLIADHYAAGTASDEATAIASQGGFWTGGTPNTVQAIDGSDNGIFKLVKAATIYSAAGTALSTCNSGLRGAQAVVADATTPTYMMAYISGGTITTAVICSYNGTTYSWLTH